MNEIDFVFFSLYCYFRMCVPFILRCFFCFADLSETIIDGQMDDSFVQCNKIGVLSFPTTRE